MDALVQTVIDALRGLPPVAVYTIVFGFGFASSAFALDLVLPGETGLLLGGWLASIAAPVFLGVYLAGATGAVAGDSFSYGVGRRWGEPLVHRWDPVRRRLEPKVERARDFYERHGGVAVFAGRWVGTLRSVVAFVAGVAGMGFAGFLVWNIAASLAWAAAVVSIGYFFGRFIVDVFQQAATAITISVITVIALWVATRWVDRHPDRVPDWVERASPHPAVAVTVAIAVATGIITFIVRGG